MNFNPSETDGGNKLLTKFTQIMNKEDLKDYLVYEAEYSEERVNKMSDFELFDAWLRYNGIIGFTDDIIDAVNCLNLK